MFVIIFLFSSFSSWNLHVFHVQYLPSSLSCSIAKYVIVPPCILIELCLLSFSSVILCTELYFWLLCSFVLTRETREGPADWKLRQMGSQRVHLNRILIWLVRWACPADTRDFVLPWLLQSAPCKQFFFHRTLFQFICSHRPTSWAGSRAGSPFYQYVSLVLTLSHSIRG
jgi:hypothetical protein